MIVVTALIGPTESPPPLPPFPGRYVCFSDRHDVVGWDVLPAPFGPPRLAARRAKMSVHQWFPNEVTLWTDAAFDLLMDPEEIVADAAKTGCQVVGFRHHDRSNIRDEGEEIIRLEMASPSIVRHQVKTYREDGFDVTGPTLTTTGFLVRWPAAKPFTDLWLKQIETHTLRDQLSVDYCAWKTGTKIGYFDGRYYENRYARYDRIRHRERRMVA